MEKILLILVFLPCFLFGQEQNPESGSSRIQIIEQDGLFKLAFMDGTPTTTFMYKKIEPLCNYFICTTEEDQKKLFNLEGGLVIKEDLKKIQINCNREKIIFGTNNDGVINLYNHQGEIISPINFSDIPTYNNYSEKNSKLVITKQDGRNCLLDFLDYSDEVPRLKIIEKPKGHNSIRIITYLPSVDGIYLKQLSMNNERFVSEPIYSEICLERDCILKYKDKIDLRLTKSILAKATGILPNLQIHVYKRDGSLLNK